jgi:hypothetical protein
MRLYIDGCSLTYGQGLPRDQSLGHLFNVQGGYEVFDASRPGKSNTAICMDTYKNVDDYDVFVLGFTFSSRFYINYNNQNLDFFAGKKPGQTDIEPQDLDEATNAVYRYFYTVFGHPYCDQLSDMLVDGCISFLKTQGKKVLGFSWEQRQTVNQLLYPYIPPKHRLIDNHLNEQGVINLYNFLQNTSEKI